MGLRDFLKNAKTDDDESGWHVGTEEDEDTIDVGAAIKAAKVLGSKLRK